MNGENQTEEKVINMFANRETQSESSTSKPKSSEAETSFAELMKKNAENSERMRKERNKANRSVLKSYRIK
jgi:hypothetical protein